MPKTPVLPPPCTAPASQTPPASASPTPAPSTKRYDDAFKRQAVEHWLRSGQSGTRIARDLGVSYPSLKDWKRRYHGEATPRPRRLGAGKPRPQGRVGPGARAARHSKKALGILSGPSKSATIWVCLMSIDRGKHGDGW